jgi:hypothetical protein
MYKRSGRVFPLSALLIIDNVQVLLLLLPLSLCGRRQIIVRTRAVILQVMERQVRQLGRLDSQILESLCILVDDLI